MSQFNSDLPQILILCLVNNFNYSENEFGSHVGFLAAILDFLEFDVSQSI